LALAKPEIGKTADVVKYLRRNITLYPLFFAPSQKRSCHLSSSSRAFLRPIALRNLLPSPAENPAIAIAT